MKNIHLVGFPELLANWPGITWEILHHLATWEKNEIPETMEKTANISIFLYSKIGGVTKIMEKRAMELQIIHL